MNYGEALREEKSLADVLGQLEDIDTKMRTVRTAGGAAKQKQPVGAQYGAGSGMTVGSGKDVQEAGKRAIRAVKRQRRGTKDAGVEVENKEARVRFQAGVKKGNNTFYLLYPEHGAGYVGKADDENWFYSVGEGKSQKKGWADSQEDAAMQVSRQVINQQHPKDTTQRHAMAGKSAPASDDGDDDAMPGLSDAEKAVYQKLIKRGMSPKQAMAMAKHAK